MSGHSTGDDTVEGLSVASNTTADTGQVARGRPQHSDMVSLSGEGKRTTIHGKRRDLLPVGHRNISFRGKCKQLGLLLHIQHAAGGGKGLGDVQERLEGMRVG